ncbi:hypothetical protein CL655_02435 [bacterium]|nr:hypothetical protein [bacterium]|tara:strand:+ start:2196 stop:2588 length:393 start_codon:yes stop_codon:yes gene_type:complete
MKFYVTGRSNNYERVKEVCARIKAAGHVIPFEWTELPMVKPYAENQEKAAEYAKSSVDGMVQTDVYIIFTHEDGLGVYTEFGTALAAKALRGKPRIMAVGKENQWVAMFNYHPDIEWFESIEDVYTELGI